MEIYWFKALHIIGFISWFAALLYFPRLLIYALENKESKHSLETKSAIQIQFQVMQKRLWLGIAWPAMIFTWTFGLLLLWKSGQIRQSWFHLKLCFLILLTFYHLTTHYYFKLSQHNKKMPNAYFFRIWNEVATLIMIVIVFIAVFKQFIFSLNYIIFFILTGLALFLGIILYKKIRNKKNK